MLRIVFQNLLINSAHAMNGKGRIHVAVGSMESTCQIAFIDSGPGIPNDIREKIFTPFFTTKSRGSGLGLPTGNGSSKRTTARLRSIVHPPAEPRSSCVYRRALDDTRWFNALANVSCTI
jgi:phosphoglycerate-specific signal transduction histidine kinase